MRRQVLGEEPCLGPQFGLQRLFTFSSNSERTVKFPSKFWNGVTENQPICPWDRSTEVFFFPNRDLSSRRGTKQAAAWDQGRNLALSTSHFLKPLDLVMCLGWESGQVGKWSDVKLKILDFPSTWCQWLTRSLWFRVQGEVSGSLGPK